MLGNIDLDPATSAVAQKHVRATNHFTKADDGLAKPWTGRVWLSPPHDQDLLSAFVRKLVGEFVAGRVTAAILLTNNETDAAWFQLALSHASRVCFPAERIRFVSPSGRSSSPSQGQALFYFGPDDDKFAQVFSEFGVVVQRTQVPEEEPAKEQA